MSVPNYEYESHLAALKLLDVIGASEDPSSDEIKAAETVTDCPLNCVVTSPREEPSKCAHGFLSAGLTLALHMVGFALDTPGDSIILVVLEDDEPLN